MSSSKSLFSHGMAKWGLFMGLLFVVWFGGWFVFASWADGKVGETIVRLKDRGSEIDCQNRDMRGFPFRIGVHCEQLRVFDRRGDLVVESGALRTAAQLYAPGKMVAELDGPFTAYPRGIETKAIWTQMRAFVDGNFSGGFDLASLNFAGLDATIGRARTQISQGAVHARPTPEDAAKNRLAQSGLDLAINLTDAKTTAPNGLAIPSATLRLDAVLENGYRNLVLGRMPLRSLVSQGFEVEFRNVDLTTGDGGRLALSGPLQLHEDGTVSGDVAIGVDNPKAVGAWAGKINPRLTRYVASIGQAVAGMGRPAKFGGTDLRAITVKIRRGEIKLGFIKLGEIPPLVLN